MRVLVNGLATIGARTGIGHYTAELIRCLEDLSQQGEGPDKVVVYRDQLATLRRIFSWFRRGLDRPGVGSQPMRSGLVNAGRSLTYRCWSWRMRRQARREACQLYHEPNFLPLDCDLPTVVTVHDLSVLQHPEWHPADRVEVFRRRFLQGLTRCVHVLAISEAGRQEIIRTLHVPPERVTRTYMGIRDGLSRVPQETVRARLHALGLPPRYLLHLGTLEPRKNVLTILQAFCALPEDVRSAHPLVLVGGLGWNSTELQAYLHDQARHRGVIQTGYLADTDLPTIYSGATALLFPSFYEGFGLPPVEMMACGGAVLASTAPAVVETVGRKACLIEPTDVAGWRDAMLQVCRDADWRMDLQRGAEDVARPFTWMQCAIDTFRVYRDVLTGGRTAPVRRAA